MSRHVVLAVASLAAGWFVLAGARTASAITLEFDPADQTVSLGDQAIVDVLVRDPGTTLVGEFDFFVEWDSAILALSDVTFGTSLGDPSLGEAITLSVGGPASPINVVEISLLSSADLGTVQTGSDFALLTLTFDSLALGTSPLDFLGGIGGPGGGFLGDDLGALIALDSVGTGSIRVVSGAVPEPSTISLLGVALAGLLGHCWRRRSAMAKLAS